MYYEHKPEKNLIDRRKYAEFVKSIDAKSIFCEKALKILLPYRSLTILLHFE